MVEEANLLCSFSRLGMDREFIEQAERLSLFNLNDIMKVDIEKLKEHKAFSFLWYTSMLKLLKEHDLLRRFQENRL